MQDVEDVATVVLTRPGIFQRYGDRPGKREVGGDREKVEREQEGDGGDGPGFHGADDSGGYSMLQQSRERRFSVVAEPPTVQRMNAPGGWELMLLLIFALMTYGLVRLVKYATNRTQR